MRTGPGLSCEAVNSDDPTRLDSSIDVHLTLPELWGSQDNAAKSSKGDEFRLHIGKLGQLSQLSAVNE